MNMLAGAYRHRHRGRSAMHGPTSAHRSYGGVNSVQPPNYVNEDLAYANGCALLTSTNDWPIGARVAMRLAETGCKVYAVCRPDNPLSMTRAIQGTYSYNGLHPLESLKSAIQATQPHLVVPCDDLAVEHLHELHAWARNSGSSGTAIAELIEHSLGNPDAYSTASSRFALLKMAVEVGVRVPDSALAREIGDFGPWRAQHAFPWVLKADGTSGGEGVRIVHTLEEAQSGFHSLKRLFRPVQAIKKALVHRDPFALRLAWNGFQPAVIVQRYVAGREANCAVACWKGRILAGIAVEVVRSQGPTRPSSVVRVVDNPEMLRCPEQIAGRLGISGLFGLDFVLEAETDSPYLIEMNPRCTPLSHLHLGRGRDMIGALWAEVSGLPLPEKPPITERDVIAYFPNAWSDGAEFLDDCFQDIPLRDPELVQALLRNRSTRHPIFRTFRRKAADAGKKAPS